MSDNTSDHHQFVAGFRQSAPYIHAHRGRTFVLLLDGDTVASPLFPGIIHDLALLSSLGVRLVIVHGARPQIEKRLSEAGLKSQIEQGLRVTDLATLEVVKQAAGSVRMDIEALLSMGTASTPMAGAGLAVASGNYVTARPLGIRNGVDFQHTGEVRRIDSPSIRRQLDDNHLVLLSPIGYSPTGEIFSLRAEEVATSVAISLKADKLILFTDGDKIPRRDKEVIHQMSLSQAREWLSQSHDDVAYFATAVKACSHGVRRSHIIDYEEDGALLLELFTRNGVGTLVTADSYDCLRQAGIDDIGGILELIKPLEDDGVLVRRNRERLEMEIDHFWVLERDSLIIACAALYPFVEEGLGELACLAVHQEYRNQQRGNILLERLEHKAIEAGLNKLFVLTTRTAHWFLERGFVATDIDALPIERQALYNFQRKSKVFIKTLEQGRSHPSRN